MAENTFRTPFPRSELYRQLRLGPARMVREGTEPDRSFPWSERHLQCVWFDASLRPRGMKTSDGEDVTVEDPGRWNLEAGPDFLDASLVIGPERRRLQGDVEVHVRAAEWDDHGHRDDPAYARVVAHVVYFPGVLNAKHLPPGAVQLALREPLRADTLFSFENIDLTAYPYAVTTSDAPPCRRALAARSPDDWERLLDSAGEERLRVKTDRIAEAIHERGEAQVFYEEMMAALGYKHNRLPFRALAARLPAEVLADECAGDASKAYALLLGVAGLLPATVATRWDDATRTFVRGLWDCWWKQSARWESVCLSRDVWRLSGLRPHNNPVRRLAAAAALFAGKRDLLTELRAADASRGAAWFKKAERLVEGAATMPYWSRRLSFSGTVQASDVALLGEGRVAAMLTNVVVPFLAAGGTDVRSLLDALPAEEENALIRQTAFSLFGRDHNPALYRSGLRQQGLLQIFHDFCLNTRTGCRDCRLVAGL